MYKIYFFLSQDFLFFKKLFMTSNKKSSSAELLLLLTKYSLPCLQAYPYAFLLRYATKASATAPKIAAHSAGSGTAETQPPSKM